MKTVYLLRHAKSARDLPDVADHERPLNARGRAACLALTRHMAAAKIAPAMVLVSDSKRTRETWQRIAERFKRPFAVHETAELYLADARTMRKLLQGLDDGLASVMLVAHNPGLEELAAGYVGADASPAARNLARKFPTGGLATLVFDAPRWGQIAAANCRLADFVTPADLGGE
ncbi:MAG TPA: histidine phosphatase family protein [Candidatus Sulfotelmatobacter sp.]|nr:histidine phosphatase family protein [Candidatus Sulfotelmatobacter sp.]